MALSWREASDSDLGLLAEWNHRLIRDEGHRNPMRVEQLLERMKTWLSGEYRAVLFTEEETCVGYALFKQEADSVYLRQFFIRRDLRRRGLGRGAFTILRGIWPTDVRLTVDVLCANHGGVAFWRSVGYQDYCLTLEIMPPN